MLLLVIAAPLRVGRAEAEISLLRSYLHIQLNILTMWTYFLPESVEKSLLLSRLLGRVARDKGPVETQSTLRAGDSGLSDQIMATQSMSTHQIVFSLILSSFDPGVLLKVFRISRSFIFEVKRSVRNVQSCQLMATATLITNVDSDPWPD